MSVRLLLVAACLLIGPLVGPTAAESSHSTSSAFQSAMAADPVHGWYTGVEATFLNPYKVSSGPMVFGKSVGGGGISQVGLTDLTDFDNLEGAPRVWLGRRGELWGMRGRYWLFDADTSRTGIGQTDTQFTFVSANQFLSAKTADLEVTRCFGLGEWRGDLFFGGRWAEFDQRASMDVGLVEATAADLPVIIDRDTAWFGSRTIASGVGLTFGWEGRRPVGDWGLAVVCNARGSTLWGDVSSRGFQGYLGENVLAMQTAEVDETGMLWIGELQVGLEWSGQLRRLNAEVFTHVVFEYQFWRAANQTPLLMEQEIITPTSTVQMATGSLGSDADLCGIAWAVGFRR